MKKNYIIFDLESTCWETKRDDSEIIEIGAIKVDENFTVVDEFQSFIQPKLNPTLSAFCTKLTSITQNEVDSAPLYTDVELAFIKWISDAGKTPFWLCSWGFYDKRMFKLECERRGRATGWLRNHISIKHQYCDLNYPGGYGMSAALEHLGIPLEGTHHRGIDDARNITKIFLRIKDKLVFDFSGSRIKRIRCQRGD